METHLTPGTSGNKDLPDASSQIVPFEAERPSSPHKRARQLPVENHEMLQLIQTTISNSIEGHLGRIESSLATLVQSTQASRLTKLESIALGQQKSLDEIQQSHTRRMDNLQAEIIQKKKKKTPWAILSPVPPWFSIIVQGCGSIRDAPGKLCRKKSTAASLAPDYLQISLKSNSLENAPPLASWSSRTRMPWPPRKHAESIPTPLAHPRRAQRHLGLGWYQLPGQCAESDHRGLDHIVGRPLHTSR